MTPLPVQELWMIIDPSNSSEEILRSPGGCKASFVCCSLCIMVMNMESS